MAENKICKLCSKEFTVTDQDLAFLDKISPSFAGQKFPIPSPTLCPACRQIKRLGMINYRKLYSRKCDKSGEQLVTYISPSSPYKVWKNDLWWKDDWDATDFGKDFDFTRPFFEQLQELSLEIPRMHSHVLMNENSEFSNGATAIKNSYMILNATYVENSYYGYRLTNCKDCVDCFSCDRTEKNYECIDANGSYFCFFCQDIENCAESLILKDCKGCKNCIGCSNLSNKQYWLYNKPSTKEEYDKERAKILVLPYEERREFVKKVEGELNMTPKRYAHITKCEESTGDYLTNCKDVINSNHVSESQNLKNCFDMYQAKDSADYDLWGANSQWLYECAEVGEKTNNIAFCDHTYNNVSNIYYSMGVFQNSKDCFGCVYLRQKQYCILNKQYSKEQYEELVAKIIEHMKQTGEWGEFFPLKLSMFAYNETIAPDYYPLNKEEATKIGAKWLDEDFAAEFSGEPYKPKDISQYKTENPDYQKNIDEALSGILKCVKTGRPYRLQAKELAFYIENDLQIPIYHPDYRYDSRISKINPLNIWSRQCDCEESGHEHQGRCQNKFETTYTPDRSHKVYCEKCYQQSIG